MTGWPEMLADLGRQTLRDPRGGVRRLLDIDPPMEARWIALLLVAVLAVLVTRVSLIAMPLGAMPLGAMPRYLVVLANPATGVPAQALSLVTAAAAIAGLGRLFGGRGGFADALLVVAWIEFLMTLAQAGELVVLLLVPPLGALLVLGVLALFAWIVVNAIAELHGFRSLIKVFVGLILGFVAVIVALAAILALLGVLPVAV